MKKTTLIAMVALAMVTVSCSKEETKYSCNPEINEWVNTNKETIYLLSREQLGQLPLYLQKAAFRAQTPQRKYELWIEKFELVKYQSSQPIAQAITELENAIEVSWYENPGNCDFGYLASWEETMLTNWTDSLSYVVNFCTLSTFDELEHNAENELCYDWITIPENIVNSNKAGGNNNCMCEWDITCNFHNGGLCNKKASCEIVSGCGLGFVYNCTGLCEELGSVVDKPIIGGQD